MTQETTVIDERVAEEMDSIIYGPEYGFQILEGRAKVTIQLSLYKSQAKKKSKSRVVRKMQGHQVAVKIVAELT